MSDQTEGNQVEHRSETTPSFAIIGAGMSGILAGIKLAEAGYGFTIFEKADKVGGTWRENTYPGIACDVPSHIYSYSFALNPDWSQFCSPGQEIQQYFEDVADSYGLHPHIRFGDAVESTVWEGGRWTLTTEAGFQQQFDWVIAATGVLHHPKFPDIAGLDNFNGPSFHSAQWDHGVELDGKAIAVIGTGSTGVQITGALANRVKKLSLFQRTAQWVVPSEATPYTDEQREQFRTDADLLSELHQSLSQAFNEGFSTGIIDASSGLAEGIEAQCREALETLIADPELREKITPTYKAACKRLVISENWYEAVQAPTVDVVVEPIEAIEPTGVRTVDGHVHEVDVLVLATGFHVDAFMRPMQVVGQDGLTLDEQWADWPSAYMAVCVPHFPNFFMLNGPNSPVGNFSLIQTAELQFQFVMSVVAAVEDGRLPVAVPTTEAARRFEEERIAAAKNTVWATGCRSWYLDKNGIPFAWPFSFERFRDEMTTPRFVDFEGFSETKQRDVVSG